jgi:MFS family permease
VAGFAVDRRPLGVPAFRRLWLASAVSAVGGSFSVIAVPARLFVLTGSSAAVGTAATISLVTLVVSALWSGVLADRLDRRRLLLIAHVTLVGVYLALSAARTPIQLYALVAVQGVTYGAIMTTMGAAVPRVVPVDLLAAASSLSSLVRNTGAIVGPLLAGALIAVDLAAMVFGLPVALYPELAQRDYGNLAVLGVLYAAYPAGVFTAGLFSGAFTRARRFGALMAGAAIAWGVTVVLLGAAPVAWLAVSALYAGGAVNFVLSTFRNAISQAYTDDALRGRIQGAMTVVLVGGPQLAGLVHGFGGAVIGGRLTIALGGVATIAAVLTTVKLVPELWQYAPATQ